MGRITRRALLGTVAVTGAGPVIGCTPQEPTGPTTPPRPPDGSAPPSPSTGQTPAGGCAPGLPGGDLNSGPFSGDESLRLSPDATLLAVARAPGGGGLVVHDVATGAIAHRFEVHSSSSPAWLAERVLCWSTEESVVVADLDSGDVHHFRLHPHSTDADDGSDAERIHLPLGKLVASPDGRRIAFTDSRDLLVADPHACSILANHPGTVPDGMGLTDEELILRMRGDVVALDPVGGGETRAFPTAANAGAFKWAAGGTTFMRGFVVTGGVYEVEVVDVATGEVLATAHEDRIGQPRLLSRDGSSLVGTPRDSEDNRVIVWDHASDTVVEVDVQQGPWNFELDPSGTLYVSGADGLAAWDVPTGTKLEITFER